MLFFVLWGFLIWLLGTILIRVAGQFFLNPESLSLLLLTFALTVPLMAIALCPIYHWRKVPPAERPLAVTSAILPSMLLDCLTVLFFPSIFPNLSPTAITPFSAWLLWGYTLALLTAFIPQLSWHTAPKQQ